ncbi:MAG: TIGR03790 family protein [Bacteroidetes bacterium]|nr:MAG: TIGR03790 family protein [Bacteroidota bacterium]
MKRTLLILTILTNAAIVRGQTASYRDVAVIVNRNSPASLAVGARFAQARSIPAQNIITVDAPAAEEISEAEFRSLRTAVEAHLTATGLTDSINYLVTTKGMPLKVLRSDPAACASVEGELSLILGPHAYYIGRSGKKVHPYFRKRGHFTRKQYGIYLVTRLDGYTLGDVYGLMDRAAVRPDSARTGTFLFDRDPLWDASLPQLNNNMSAAAAVAAARGHRCTVDSTERYVTGATGLLGYVSWGSNDHHAAEHGAVSHSWLPGAVAETYVSTSARTFTSPAVYGQSLIADLVAEGVTAVKGYVYEPYSTAMAEVQTLVEMHADGYAAAESFYSASPYVSWMDVVIGDPKFRLTAQRMPSDYAPAAPPSGGSPLPAELVSFTAVTTGDRVELRWTTATELNNTGFEIQRMESRRSAEESMDQWNGIGFVHGAGTSNAPRSYSFVDKSASGSVVYRLKQLDADGTFSYSAVVRTEAAAAPTQSGLHQNYPNPFNSATMLRFSIPVAGPVRLSVHDATGKEVAVPVNSVLASGQHSVPFDASLLSSGVYFYTLSTPLSSSTKKMLLIK